MKNVTIMGAGYVGLPTAAHWASQHNVTVYDPFNDKIKCVKGTIEGKNDNYIHEKGLDEKLRNNKSRLIFTSSLENALENPDFVFIAVGTPPNNKGRADLSYVAQAASDIGKVINKDCIVVNKSTVPPGTAYLVEEKINDELKKRGEQYNISVGSCPEFMAEGTAMENLRTPDRIVFGCDNPKALDALTNFFLYQHDRSRLVPMRTVSSELTKYAANSMLASRLSFMNELSILCDEIGADVKEIERGIGLDFRIGKKFLKAGFGYGGSCFGKDTMAISQFGRLSGVDLGVINAAIKANGDVVDHFFQKIRQHYAGNLSGRNLAIWGVGFKAGTDDLRDSRSVELVKRLERDGANLVVYDPVPMALTNFNQLGLANCVTCNEQYDTALEKIDGIVIGNEAMSFRDPDISKLTVMRNKVIFDGKNCVVEPALNDLRENGFIYKSMGKDIMAACVDKNKLVRFLEEEYMS